MIHKAKRERQPKCSPMDEWISKMRSIPTMEHYLALKRKDIPIHVGLHYRKCPEQADPQRQETGEWSSEAGGGKSMKYGVDA